MQCLADALQQRDFENSRAILSDLIDLAAADASLLRPCFEQLLSAALSTCADKSVEPSLRHACLELFLTLCESKPGIARKVPQLVERAAPVLLAMLVTENDDVSAWAENVGDVDDEDEDDESVRYGEEALERLLSAIGGNRVVPCTLSLLPASLQSPHWQHRSGAYRAIGVVVTSTDKALKPHLDTLVQWSVAGLNDAHYCVKHAASGSIAALCTCFGPQVQKAHHGAIIPALIQMLDGSMLPRLRSRAAKVPPFPPLFSPHVCRACVSRLVEALSPLHFTLRGSC